MVTHILLYLIGFMQADTAAMQRQAEWATGKPQEPLMLSFQSAAAAFSGRLQKAREISQRAAELAQRASLTETAALLAAYESLTEAEFGMGREARAGAARAMAINHGRSAMPYATTALALSGDEANAQRLMEEWHTRYPADTMANDLWMPTARAAIEINRGNPAQAIDLLKAAARYELGSWPGGVHFVPIYMRGQAYLRAKQGDAAAKEFQKILEHRGVSPISPLYALAHLGLGRASRLADDTATARRADQDFLALWKDADPDIPILQEAKREYAELR